MGLVSVAEREVVQQYVNNISLALKSGDTYAAFKFWDAMLNGDLTPYPPYFKNVTGSSNYYNILRTGSPVEYSYYPKYLSQAWVRKAIHVGDNVFHNGTTVEMHLAYDFFGTEAKVCGCLFVPSSLSPSLLPPLLSRACLLVIFVGTLYPI